LAAGRYLKFLGNVLFGIAAVAIGGGLLALTVLPSLLRYQTYVVLSGSMEPTIHVGSVIVATAVDPKSLQVGDIITFLSSSQQENVTHRIVGLHGDAQGRVSFITKGDANGVQDQDEIRFDHLAGKVTLTIPYLGYFFKFVGSPSMRLLFIVVPGMLLLGSWLWDIWRPESKDLDADEEIPASMAPAPLTGPSRPARNRELGLSSAADAAAVPIRR
jgi:signal peptidase I